MKYKKHERTCHYRRANRTFLLPAVAIALLCFVRKIELYGTVGELAATAAAAVVILVAPYYNYNYYLDRSIVSYLSVAVAAAAAAAAAAADIVLGISSTTIPSSAYGISFVFVPTDRFYHTALNKL